ncbi:MAG: histone family protein DNA-binding protein [Acidimicrobiaceae bacterium]|nr:histone family protein DNA-binding protein [Acidimicrobiaceae bacterium]
MNRTELVDAVSTDTGLTRQQSEAALEAIVYEVTAGVRGGNPVRITGFGTFKLRERKARRGRNPQTGAPVRVKASKGIGFTPGVKLKADLNSKGALAKPKAAPAPRAAASATKAVATRTVATKTAAKKAAPAKRATATKAVATKAVAKKAAVKKVAAKATPARATAAKRPAATKAVARKAPAKRATKRT